MKKILFVGLGRMGFPMVGHIAKTKLYSVSVYNRSKSKIDKWFDQYKGAPFLHSDVFDVIILCIGNDEDVRSSLTGSLNLLSRVKSGGTIVDHTTTSATLAQEMYAAAKECNVGYLDAPVSGGEAGAVNGQLSCMIGGDNQHLNNVASILDSYCKTVTYIGDSGSGQIAKMANQFCIAGTLAGLSEAITLLKKSNVSTEQAFQAIKGGAAQSWQMDNRFGTMTQGKFDFGFATDHMIKDLKYALQLADQQQWQPEVSQQILRWYKSLSENGHNTHDTSCLINHYKN
ncbi:NAD(P)-dependent oxidoreductase [Microbulbifer sp. JMSA003]|uniref:NAD(P)-dependent oxidoreductase n=1 Tax=Microbulbifer sp. JMSA003 TaxID=3243369 RepID=UPI0040392A77